MSVECSWFVEWIGVGRGCDAVVAVRWSGGVGGEWLPMIAEHGVRQAANRTDQ